MARLNRRQLMGATALTTVALAAGRAWAEAVPSRVHPVPARHVTLKPSIFAQAQAANRDYLAFLSPDRLLHNVLKAAGLPPKGEIYGGWEGQSIAGHTLGHYLSGCALLVANTGDALLRERLAYTVAEMARAQAAHGDGYVGAGTLWGQADPVAGKSVYERLRVGDIDVNPFWLNGGWVPVYAWHKIHAGLLAAHELARIPGALDVAVGMAGYVADILDRLDDAQVQRVLVAEHGGINEAYADTYVLTGDPRWLAVARRLRHRAVLDPLAEGRDQLAGLHANTQIPKVIGLARLFEVGGDPAEARTARFFHETVTRRHSYVIGGNSDREHFGPPGEISPNISETTCEACNTYNMLKLTRHLYGWEPRAALFDDYERAQLNHIMAHQRPDTGRFVYFMPMAAGSRRSYSTPEDSFWCCVGSGMESHAKHADSIYWRGGETLYVNLYIPSTLSLPDGGLGLSLDTAYPMDGTIRLTVTEAPRGATEIALRLPGWSPSPTLSLNGRDAAARIGDGYARLRRTWRAGDEIELTLPMPLRMETPPDDARLAAFVSGPLVLAADLGPADAPYDRPAPALIADGDPARLMTPKAGEPHVFTAPLAQGGEATFRPFFNQYDRRTAIYAPVFTPARWAAEGEAFTAAETRRIDLGRRTVDAVFLGEQQPEVDHAVRVERAEIIQLNGRSGRRIKAGGHVEARLARRPQPMLLRLVHWAGDAGQRGRVSIDGVALTDISWPAEPRDGFASIDLALPPGETPATVRIEALAGDLVLYEMTALLKA